MYAHPAGDIATAASAHKATHSDYLCVAHTKSTGYWLRLNLCLAIALCLPPQHHQQQQLIMGAEPSGDVDGGGGSGGGTHAEKDNNFRIFKQR